MNEKKAREDIEYFGDPDKVAWVVDRAAWQAKGYLEAREKARGLEEALGIIAHFHDKPLEEIEKETGFLGWTCCGQKTKIAEKALAKFRGTI